MLKNANDSETHHGRLITALAEGLTELAGVDIDGG